MLLLVVTGAQFSFCHRRCGMDGCRPGGALPPQRLAYLS
jgi:hypothetical protein